MSKKSKQDLDIADSVMSKIEEQNISMHSKIYFIGWTTALVLSVMLSVFFASVVLTSIFDDIKNAREAEIFAFEDGGSFIFSNAPWFLLLFFVVALYSAYLLTSRFEFARTKKHYGVLGMVVSSVMIISSVLVFTGVSESLSNGPLKPFKRISNTLEDKSFTVDVVEISEDKMVVNIKEAEYKVEAPTPIIMKFNSYFDKGDKVKMYGEVDEDQRVIRIFGAKPFKDLKNRTFDLRGYKEGSVKRI